MTNSPTLTMPDSVENYNAIIEALTSAVIASELLIQYRQELEEVEEKLLKYSGVIIASAEDYEQKSALYRRFSWLEKSIKENERAFENSLHDYKLLIFADSLPDTTKFKLPSPPVTAGFDPVTSSDMSLPMSIDKALLVLKEESGTYYKFSYEV